jgi:pseudouridylate synthase
MTIRVWLPEADSVAMMGGLPDGMIADVWTGDKHVPASADEVEVVVLPIWLPSSRMPVLAELPRLKLIQLMSAGAEHTIGFVPPGVTLCNARGVHDPAVAEWAVAVILAQVRQLPRFMAAQRAGHWDQVRSEALAGQRVLIVGYGSIGEAIERMLAPFEVTVDRVARRARPGVLTMDDLPYVLPKADIVILLVPVTPATTGLVDARFLAQLHDHALLVNAARGSIVDTGALLAELRSGRLRAALDVTDPEPLPDGHPLWSAPGLLLTPHVAGAMTTAMPRVMAMVKEQLTRYAAGEPLHNVVGDQGYYDARIVFVPSLLEVSPRVSAALAAGDPVVALESTIISHGLPRPGNLDAARQFEAILADAGVTAATIALIDGVPKIGLLPADLERIAADESVVKISSRDIGIAMARKVTGGTTVAATSVLAARAGIGVFATGGLGGVHRGAADTFDESADLTVLSRTPITVVSAGVKSILDIPATLERLETLSVAVVGYQTSRFPAFWLSDSGCDLDWRADTPEELADIMAARAAFGEQSALLVANPLPTALQLDPGVLDSALEDSLAVAADQGVRGKAVSPFLLDRIQQVTGGMSVEVNLHIARGNIELAAKIAASWATRAAGPDCG